MSRPKLIQEEAVPVYCQICGERQRGDRKLFNHRDPKTGKPCRSHLPRQKVQA